MKNTDSFCIILIWGDSLLFVLQCTLSIITLFIVDEFYGDEKELSLDLVKCLNREIRALSKAGCVYIQVDEPVIAREPKKALDFGIDHLKMCFEVIKTVLTCIWYHDSKWKYIQWF